MGDVASVRLTWTGVAVTPKLIRLRPESIVERAKTTYIKRRGILPANPCSALRAFVYDDTLYRYCNFLRSCRSVGLNRTLCLETEKIDDCADLCDNIGHETGQPCVQSNCNALPAEQLPQPRVQFDAVGSVPVPDPAARGQD